MVTTGSFLQVDPIMNPSPHMMRI